MRIQHVLLKEQDDFFFQNCVGMIFGGDVRYICSNNVTAPSAGVGRWPLNSLTPAHSSFSISIKEDAQRRR